MKTLSILKNTVSRVLLSLLVVLLSSTLLFSGFITSNAEELLTPQIYNIGEDASILLTVINRLPIEIDNVSRGSISVCVEKTDGSYKNSMQFIPRVPQTVGTEVIDLEPLANITNYPGIPSPSNWQYNSEGFDSQSMFIKPGNYNIRIFENQTDSVAGVMNDNCYFDENDLTHMILDYPNLSFTNSNPSQVEYYTFPLFDLSTNPDLFSNLDMLGKPRETGHFYEDNLPILWRPWQTNGASLSPVTMARVGDVSVFQAVRGTDSNVYTRYKLRDVYASGTRDGSSWSSWIPNGATLGQVSMVEYRGKLIQTVRGTDNNIYTRDLIDLNNQSATWSAWTPNGATFGEVSTAVYGDQLVQTVRGTDNNIYTRVRRGDSQFGNWVPNGSTFGDISMMTYRNALFQAVKGTDNAIYIRHSFNPQNNEWSSWRFLKDQDFGSPNPALPVRIVSQPSIGVHNNIMYISATDSIGGITTHIYADKYIESNKYVYTPNANAAYVTTDGVDAADYAGRLLYNQGLQMIVRRDNTIGMRTFSGFPLGQFGGIETIPGNTNLPIQTIEVQGILIQSYIGTDNQIYTRETRV